MRKRRGDSPWSKLTVEQRKLMDKWYFDENLPYPEILERATKEFGVQASRQTVKVLKGMSRLQSKEEYEEMVMQMADILQRARAKAAANR